jgi:hypothetical protein
MSYTNNMGSTGVSKTLGASSSIEPSSSSTPTLNMTLTAPWGAPAAVPKKSKAKGGKVDYYRPGTAQNAK